MRLENKVAVITGAGSGIGRASALRFAAEGAQVMAIDVNKKDWMRPARLLPPRACRYRQRSRQMSASPSR